MAHNTKHQTLSNAGRTHSSYFCWFCPVALKEDLVRRFHDADHDDECIRRVVVVRRMDDSEPPPRPSEKLNREQIIFIQISD